MRFEFEKGFVLAPIGQDKFARKRAENKNMGKLKGIKPMSEEDQDATYDSAYHQEGLIADHPRRVKYEHRMQLKSMLPSKLQSMVTMAKRNTKAGFLEKFGEHSAAIQKATSLGIDEFWRQVNNGPNEKHKPKKFTPLLDVESEALQPIQQTPESKPAPKESEQEPAAAASEQVAMKWTLQHRNGPNDKWVSRIQSDDKDRLTEHAEKMGGETQVVLKPHNPERTITNRNGVSSTAGVRQWASQKKQEQPAADTTSNGMSIDELAKSAVAAGGSIWQHAKEKTGRGIAEMTIG